jgi:hypothetical protein
MPSLRLDNIPESAHHVFFKLHAKVSGPQGTRWSEAIAKALCFNDPQQVICELGPTPVCPGVPVIRP